MNWRKEIKIYNPGVNCANYGDQCQNYVRNDNEYCDECLARQEESRQVALALEEIEEGL